MPDLELILGMNRGYPRKIMPIIYVIDTSGGMMGIRIAAVNQAMHETIPVLKKISAENPNAELKIGILQFGSGANWVTGEDGLVSLEDFVWSDLKPGGLASLGAALDELYNKLSRRAFLNSEVAYKKPVLIFINDCDPTDDYRTALKTIKTNAWFQVATKIAIAIYDADTDVLTEITGNSESVFKVTDMETLKKLIKVVSVNAAKR